MNSLSRLRQVHASKDLREMHIKRLLLAALREYRQVRGEFIERKKLEQHYYKDTSLQVTPFDVPSGDLTIRTGCGTTSLRERHTCNGGILSHSRRTSDGGSLSESVYRQHPQNGGVHPIDLGKPMHYRTASG